MKKTAMVWFMTLVLVLCGLLPTALAATENGFAQQQYSVFVGKTVRPKIVKKGIKGKITYEFRSSDESVATVNSSGAIKGVAPGVATITGTAFVKGQEAFKLQADVSVSLPVKKITASVSKLNLAPGVSWKIETTVTPENATHPEITWKSSKRSVATVSADGVVTAQRRGSCQIVGTANDGSKTKVRINVKVSNYQIVITSPDGADAQYKTVSGETTVSYTAKNECVEVAGNPEGSIHLTPLKAGADKVTVTVARNGSKRTTKTSYSVFVAPSALQAASTEGGESTAPNPSVFEVPQPTEQETAPQEPVTPAAETEETPPVGPLETTDDSSV